MKGFEGNIITNHFTIGCKNPEYRKLNCIDAYLKFINSPLFKPNTMFFSFIEIIELNNLKEITINLYRIYKKKFPFSEIIDFETNILASTIFGIKRIIKYSIDIEWISTEKNYAFYEYWHSRKNEYLYFVIDSNKEIEYYIQYLKAVLDLFADLIFLKNIKEEKKEPKLKNISNLRELLYQINNKNSNVLAKEFDFNESDKDYIQRTFWPIITLNKIDVDSIKAKTIDFKEEFIGYYKEFDIDIFKREHLNEIEFHIKKFLDAIEKGKYTLWNTKKGENFYHLKLDSERNSPRNQTLLITEKDEIQLEMYFKKIIEFIERYTAEPKFFNPKNTIQKTEETIKSKRLITDVQLKNKIAHELIGDNKISNKSIEYHYIDKILNKYSISKIEARQILLDMKGSFSPSTNEIIVEPIINYFERSIAVSTKSLELLPNAQKVKEKEKYEIILPNLLEHKFNELEKVLVVDLNILVKHIFTRDLPYQIAYLEYLGFITAINENYTNSKEASFKLLAKIIKASARRIKGNINVLNPISRENKKRYTSHLHTEKVKEHYKSIK